VSFVVRKENSVAQCPLTTPALPLALLGDAAQWRAVQGSPDASLRGERGTTLTMTSKSSAR
jgi:hypothetical protein